MIALKNLKLNVNNDQQKINDAGELEEYFSKIVQDFLFTNLGVSCDVEVSNL